MIVLDGHTSGDGLAAALLLCGILAASGRIARRRGRVTCRHFPQAKANVRVRTKTLSPELVARVDEVNAGLAGTGRVLVRPSGTEPVVRVLAEAERETDAAQLCATLAAFVEEELG